MPLLDFNQNVHDHCNEAPHDPRMAQMRITPSKLFPPVIRDIFLFAKFRTNGGMDMMPDLVEKHTPQRGFSYESQPTPQLLL